MLFALISSGCGASAGNPGTSDSVAAASATNARANSVVEATDTSTEAVAFITLPGDEGPHVAGIEWWYFNGHLVDELEQEYSFHFVTFQTSNDSGQAGQLLQLSWADHTEDLYLTAEKVNLTFSEAASGTARGRFSMQSASWQMAGDGNDYTFAFDTGAYSVRLQATSLKQAVLHQGTGLVSLGPAGDTLYYTRPRLELSGTVTVDGQPHRVMGQAWMDHQWGEFSSRQVGWDWMSLQMDSGSELMAVLVWDPEEREPYATYGTFIASDGSVKHLQDGAISFSPTGSWTSPATGTVYPMGWDLRIGSLDLALELTPALRQAEFPHSSYGPPSYWEGAVSLAGEVAGSRVTGKGFVELVGYGKR